MMMKRLLSFGALAVLAACSSGPEVRYAVPEIAPEARVQIVYRSVEVRDVTLPSYAELEQIFIETPEGALESSELLWADDPSRGATLELSRALAIITQRPVASEPWPFESYPDARVEVRVEEFVASQRTSEFRLSGQYFVASLEGRGRDGSGVFRVNVALPAEAGPAEIAAARGEAMSLLAEQIAREGLR